MDRPETNRPETSRPEAGRPDRPAFNGLRVLSFESRRAPEMATLIAAYGGEAISACAMKEVPLESNADTLAFVRSLLQGGFDMLILLTGVGTRALARVATSVCSAAEFAQALRRVSLVARGPKPAAALVELGAPPTITIPEPCTWRDLLGALDAGSDSLPLLDRRVAVQEYGASNPAFLAALVERGAQVTRVPVYEWALPDDLGPLQSAVESLIAGRIDLVLFTSSTQLAHLRQVAGRMKCEGALRRSFAKVVVGSIGPMMSEALVQHGITPDFEPAHSKMGFLVNEAARRAPALLAQKRPAL